MPSAANTKAGRCDSKIGKELSSLKPGRLYKDFLPGSLPADSVLVTGGWGPSGTLATTEVLGSTCSVAALPEPRSEHVTFLTPDR